MTHRLANLLSLALFVCGCICASSLLSTAQDSPQEPSKNDAVEQPKKAEQSTGAEAAKDQAGPAADKDQSKKDEDARKAEDTPPPLPSPKLIEVPQDDVTYTPHPKVVAVFVFTNGNRIEADDYLITKDALFINKDGRKTRYPINTVDRAATKAANQGRGVDIVFPKSRSEFNLDF